MIQTSFNPQGSQELGKGRKSLFNQGGKKIGIILLQAINKRSSIPLKLDIKQKNAAEKKIKRLKVAFDEAKEVIEV